MSAAWRDAQRAMTQRLTMLQLVDELLGMDAEYATNGDAISATHRDALHREVREVVERHLAGFHLAPPVVEPHFVADPVSGFGIWVNDEKGDG